MEKADKKRIKDAIVKSIVRGVVNIVQVMWLALLVAVSYDMAKRGDVSFLPICFYIYTAMEAVTTFRHYSTTDTP